MSDKSTSLLDRLLGSSKKKMEGNKGELEKQVKEQLKTLVYEDELVEELLPVFLSLQGQQGFDKVVELLTTKEKQIEAISGGDWFKKETEDKENHIREESKTSTQAELVDAILKKQYEGKQ
ncbi:MAG TPA: hypothetical protein VL020_06170 [Pseudomonadales bacterium]|nr:hypothetical protein [Pseudomonadales bacterium]